METVTTRREQAEAWLAAFAAAVRERDYERGQSMFDADATGFGTVSTRYEGVDQLEHGQWREVWERTEGFTFDLDSATFRVDGNLVVALSEWTSTGRDVGGSARPRRGRATIVLIGTDDEMRAVHTHFSMAPGFES